MNRDIQKSVATELAFRRAEAGRLAEEKRKQIYKQNPELAQIEELMNAVHIRRSYLRLRREMPKQIADRMGELAPELVQATEPVLERALERMQNRKTQILSDLHLTEGDFAPVYTCANCKDTGALHNAHGEEIPCNCYKILLTESLRAKANLPANTETFQDFRAEYYPETPNAKEYGISQSPKAHMIKMKERCEAFVEHFTSPEHPNLLFIGRSGVGKTFLSNCIASGLLEKGVPVLYMPVSSLFRPFSAAAFATDEEKEMLWYLKNLILNVELLIIDDLGTEKQTATRYEEVLEILNTREANGKTRPCKTIITTNMSPENLFETYGERVASRILGSFDILPLCGDDIRLKRKGI